MDRFAVIAEDDRYEVTVQIDAACVGNAATLQEYR
jgi:hypothetical protein